MLLFHSDREVVLEQASSRIDQMKFINGLKMDTNKCSSKICIHKSSAKAKYWIKCILSYYVPIQTIGCSSVIEYSRNLIWPRSIFFILSVWCWFSYGVLINSNNVWIWGIIQISKIFARLWQFSFLFYMCYNFLLMTRSLGCA